MSTLNIVISGQVVRENSANLKAFWGGFVNIQKSIPDVENLNIFAHSWNPEMDDVVSSVYAPKKLHSEKQPNFSSSYMPVIQPVNKFEQGLKRSESIWNRISPQSLIGISQSRSKAISLLESDQRNQDEWVVATRWDQGLTGSKDVNTIIADPSLSPDYFYLAYYPEVDEGYADMWFYTSVKHATVFKQYGAYIFDSLSGKNDFFDRFTETGWPLAKIKEPTSRVRRKIEQISIPLAYRSLDFVTRKVQENSKLELKLKGVRQRVEKYHKRPFFTGENSFEAIEGIHVTYPNYQALNIHAMLKSFCIDSGLRDSIRFLHIEDFENQQVGRLINPIDFAYVIYSHSSFSDCWEMAIGQAKDCLPKNCGKIYLISDDSEETQRQFEQLESSEEVSLLLYSNEDNYTKRVSKCLKQVNAEFDYVYFVHEDMPPVSSIDAMYLNAMLHYLNNGNEFYIKLVDTSYVDKKEEHTSFPGLVKNSGGYSFSVQPSLMKLEDVIPFYDAFDEDIYSLERLVIESNFVFSSVKGSEKVGKYLLINEHFPHVATAILKGKWCTDEWPEEIRYLANKYDIDLSLRGEVNA